MREALINIRFCLLFLNFADLHINWLYPIKVFYLVNQSNYICQLPHVCPVPLSVYSLSLKSNRSCISKHMFLVLGGLQLLFDDLTANSTKRFVAAAVGKIYNIRTEKLHELGAPMVN